MYIRIYFYQTPEVTLGEYKNLKIKSQLQKFHKEEMEAEISTLRNKIWRLR